jgi:hypothetical protein
LFGKRRRLGKQLRHEALTFGYPLDLDRDCFHSALEPLEPAVRLTSDLVLLRFGPTPSSESPPSANDGEEEEKRESASGESFLEIIIARPVDASFFGPSDEISGR